MAGSEHPGHDPPRDSARNPQAQRCSRAPSRGSSCATRPRTRRRASCSARPRPRPDVRARVCGPRDDVRARPTAGGAGGPERAIELAETARMIDPDAADVHWALGFVYAQDRRIARRSRRLRTRHRARSHIRRRLRAARRHLHLHRAGRASRYRCCAAAMRLNPDGGYLYFPLAGPRIPLRERRRAGADQPAGRGDAQSGRHRDARLPRRCARGRGDDARARWESDEIRALRPDFSGASGGHLPDGRRSARATARVPACRGGL